MPLGHDFDIGSQMSTDYGTSLKDNIITQNMSQATRLQQILLNKPQIGVEELPKVLTSINLSKGIFDSLTAHDLLKVAPAKRILFEARKAGFPTDEFRLFFGELVYRVKMLMAPNIYANYGFSQDQIMFLMEKIQKVHNRFLQFREAVEEVGEPQAGRPPEHIRVYSTPIMEERNPSGTDLGALEESADEILSDDLTSMSSLEDDIVRVD